MDRSIQARKQHRVVYHRGPTDGKDIRSISRPLARGLLGDGGRIAIAENV